MLPYRYTLPPLNSFEVVVVGAGHAGAEAALASARMGRATACITLSLDRIGHLPCNCSIGGPAKGHMAREVDALGGQMAITADHAVTHLRRVATGKGPAVQTVRAQVCKNLYPAIIRQALESQPNLTLIEGEALSITTGPDAQVAALLVRLTGCEVLRVNCRCVVVTTGTFMNGLCHTGSEQVPAGRHGDRAVASLGESLRSFGIRMARFKTGTTPRVRMGSLRLDRALVLPSEPEAGPLSFLHEQVHPRHDLLPTWQTRTTPRTHELLHNNLQRSALFGGHIEGVGPRYCPSIEDKVVRFAHKESHPVFLERETWDCDSVYVQGFSSSMPADVQLDALRTLPGLEQVEMIRPGYAVEYDMADPLQLHPTLMSKQLDGLFLAGQVNGTSGYEEAAGQGLIAGINAALYARGEEGFTLGRDTSFIGVMIDDLVTKGVEDPYRMLTARAEHRLLLRHDNADQRLTPLAIGLGLASPERTARLEQRLQRLESGKRWLVNTHLWGLHDHALVLEGMVPLGSGKASLWDLLRRPGTGLERLLRLAESAGHPAPVAFDPDTQASLEVEAMYEGYLKRQSQEAAQAARLEKLGIPEGFDYAAMPALSHEAREKWGRVRPRTVGQASRVPGTRVTDVALLIGYVRGALASKGS